MKHGAWPLQQKLHRKRKRFTVLVAHRRFGKTVFGLTKLLRAAAKTKEQAARYAYLAPFQRQAKAVVWDMLKHQARASASTAPAIRTRCAGSISTASCSTSSSSWTRGCGAR